jgi:hypothetical protein
MYHQIPPKFTVSVKSNTSELGSTHLSYLLAAFLASHGFRDVVVDSPEPPSHIDPERLFTEFPRTSASVVIQDFGARASPKVSRPNPVQADLFTPTEATPAPSRAAPPQLTLLSR